LRWDSHHENNQDRIKHGTYSRGEDHPMAKLTIEQVRVIRAASSATKVAKELSVAYQTVYSIRSGRTWRGIE